MTQFPRFSRRSLFPFRSLSPLFLFCHTIYIYIYLYTLCTHVMCTLPRIPVSRVFLFFRVCTRGLRSRFINLIVGKGARSSSLVVLRIYIYTGRGALVTPSVLPRTHTLIRFYGWLNDFNYRRRFDEIRRLGDKVFNRENHRSRPRRW